jgi:hypothetical protein
MKVVLSYGLGVDSTALLFRWLTEPDSRNFDLDDLLVVTAMTGDEWPDTVELVERHVLPRLAEAGVTYVQVARGGASQKDGITILDESDEPHRLYADGAYRLSDELTRAGTVPQAAGSRYCSQKFKGWVIDTYLAECAPEAIRHAFGYEAGEVARAARCEENMPQRLAFGFESGETARARRATQFDSPLRVAEFPLIEWGWDREDCLRFIQQTAGISSWPKSACVYCPFALTNRAGRERTLDRYGEDRESAMDTLMLERRSLCLNPRGGLIAGDRLFDLLWKHRPPIAKSFERLAEEAPHSVYEVRRIWRSKRQANRDLRVLHTGSRAECEALVREHGKVDDSDGIGRVYLLRKGEELPTREHFIVAGPAGAKEKALPSFARWWEELDHQQLTLPSEELALAA